MNVFSDVPEGTNDDVPDGSGGPVEPAGAVVGEKKRDRTRRKILDAALELFREEGFDRATMRQVAKRAGMSLGAAYYYFRSKEAIVGAYYDYVQAEHLQRARARFPDAKDFSERLHLALSTKLDILADDRRLLVALFRYGGDPDHPLSWFGEATRPQREASEAVFALALGDESLPADLRAGAPRLLWALHMGLILYFVFDKSAHQLKTRRLLEASVSLVVQAKRLVGNPLLKPLRRRVIASLEEAELLPEAAG